MIKQLFITGIAATGILLSAQSSAHNGNSGTIWNNSVHHHKHLHKVRRPAPKPIKFRINKEQRKQAAMIQQGIKNCRITPREANRLNNRQNRIKALERKMRRDGLQRWERKDLKKRLHNARTQINKLTNNRKRCNRYGNKRHQHSHGHNHHQHTHGNRFHTHTSWGFTNRHGTFSMSFGH